MRPGTPGTLPPPCDRSRSITFLLDAALFASLLWLSLLAVMRVATNPRAIRTPLSVDDASDQVTRWLDEPAAVIAQPTSRHAAILTGLLRNTGTAGNLVNDAHLTALAIEHGAQIRVPRSRLRALRGRAPPPAGVTASDELLVDHADRARR
ncbi:MAG: hypothetical protein WKF42_08260 [Solirubrobacteraceae bacterium]